MEQAKKIVCPDCEALDIEGVDRRDFLKGMSAAAAVAATGAWTTYATPRLHAAPTPQSAAETAVQALYETLTAEQKGVVCFAWDYEDKSRGLLRNHVSNNWHITKPTVDSNFFTSDQKALIRKVYENVFNPDWVERIDKQLKDDTGGRPWGAAQNIAIFGTPGDGKFKFVMTGRHLTIRCDGNSEAHVPWGGPIFHGHAASGFNEKVGHPGNVFWHQALEANKVYQILSGKQQQQALVPRQPAESAVEFRGSDGKFPGIPVSELSKDQREGVQKVLMSLIEPYRKEDRDEILACLNKQGGLDKCSLAFYQEGDLGDDGEWDVWRLEGPAFVWYFRGTPHVHIWINIAEVPTVPLNARG
ncbi:MAG: DUF3500 domain-containing protein [Gemmataceae bacterium]